MSDVLLSIDCGTQSLRALMFSTNGDLIDKEQIFYEPYYSIKPGYAEQDPDVYWNSLAKATQILKKRNLKEFENIKGLSVTAMRASMVALDKEGEIVRPTIIWLDQRKADIFYKPNFFWDIIFKIIRMRPAIDKMQKEGKANWIRQFEPQNWEKTHKYVQISGFLNYKLTGEYKDSIASQIGHIPFDYRKQEWANPKNPLAVSAKIFPVEKEKLSELVKPGELIGKISEKAEQITGLKKNTPVIAAGSDKGCETLGMGVVDNSMASLSFGTTATVQTSSSKYIETIPFMPSYPSVIPDFWNPEVEIFRGFWMISWFKNEFALKEVQEAEKRGISAEEVMNEMLCKTSAGAMGLIVQPFWTPGMGEKNAKGAMIGFGDIHKKEHMYRAVIEGLAYSLRDGMEKIQKRGKMKFHKLTVSGGASQSAEICQITADVFNLPLLRGKTYETSGLGAAIITAYGLGLFDSIEQASQNMVHYQETFKPNPENAKLYNQLFKDVYQKMYKKLEPLNKKIKEITGYPE